jgi:hypothetical protein
MRHAEIISLLLTDARSRKLNAACAFVVRCGGTNGYQFNMKGHFNPHAESILPLLAKLLCSVRSDTSSVALGATSYILYPAGISSEIPVMWWDIWSQCRGKPYSVHRRDVSADDQEVLIRILRWLLDEHAHHANPWNWTKITLGQSQLEAYLDQPALAECQSQLKRESENSEHNQ